MKTTVDLPETLLAEARAVAERRGWTVRVVFEESLREFIQRDASTPVPTSFLLAHSIAGGENPPAMTFNEMLELTNPSRLPE